ncbi:hypothetical protein PMIN01_02417 [Paraphaeosphaeria minitans]|uniref:Uncharacterized protein n=1 Tax=Paraphaeosphaeria minitans TaxID=565426 RepID=A0A9P6GR94_9PLEO|nr:hypothetical protein PMIN01_02417 [Paraphaeosphaeria minitans]
MPQSRHVVYPCVPHLAARRRNANPCGEASKQASKQLLMAEEHRPASLNQCISPAAVLLTQHQVVFHPAYVVTHPLCVLCTPVLDTSQHIRQA